MKLNREDEREGEINIIVWGEDPEGLGKKSTRTTELRKEKEGCGRVDVENILSVEVVWSG